MHVLMCVCILEIGSQMSDTYQFVQFPQTYVSLNLILLVKVLLF